MLHQIGIGTLGPVYRTYEPTRDRLVAVKVFRLDIVPEQAQALAAALGRAAQASLRHPSIVEPIAAGVEGTVAYRAEEYVAAESLDVAMRHYAPAPIEKVLPFITQLAGAIDFARAAGVGHGGLHPRDIFVTPDDARATGFGVVEALEEVGIRAPIRRPYSAPERIDGGAWGTPADVFSLAAITFELLSARRPAGTGAQIGALPQSTQRDGLHAVLARAMHDEPSRRYATALALAGALESAARGESVPEPAVEEPAVSRSRLPPPTIPASTVQRVPIHEALGDAAAPTLFDPAVLDRDQHAHDAEDVAGEARASFPEEQSLDGGIDRMAEGGASQGRGQLLGLAGYGGAALESFHDAAPEERSRTPVLPYAGMLLIGLLLGFAGGHFVGRRDRLTPEPSKSAPVASAPAPQVAPSGPATREKPGQYSEQKVSPPPLPAPAAATPRSEPPPTVSEASPATRGRVSRPQPAADAAASHGRVIVRSIPSRAGVMMNGKWRGRTPLTIDTLPFGTYVIRVVQPGFRVAHDEFTLGRHSTEHTFVARLERKDATERTAPAAPAGELTGSLYVDSNPRGATVLLDGRSMGQTPLRLPEISVGTHVVRLELAGKKPWTSTTRVAAGEPARVTGSLEDKHD